MTARCTPMSSPAPCAATPSARPGSPGWCTACRRRSWAVIRVGYSERHACPQRCRKFSRRRPRSSLISCPAKQRPRFGAPRRRRGPMSARGNAFAAATICAGPGPIRSVSGSVGDAERPRKPCGSCGCSYSTALGVRGLPDTGARDGGQAGPKAARPALPPRARPRRAFRSDTPDFAETTRGPAGH